MIAQHDVEDVDHWRAAPTREELSSPLGIRTFVDETNPARVAVLMDVTDMDEAGDPPEALLGREHDDGRWPVGPPSYTRANDSGGRRWITR